MAKVRMGEDFLRDCADKGGIQAAGEQEAHRSVRVQPFSDAVGQQPVQFHAYGVLVLHDEPVHMGRVGIGVKRSVDPVMAGREGKDRFAQAHKVLGLAGEGPSAVLQPSVIQGPDADGIAGGDDLVLFPVIEDQGELCVQGLEHLDAVFMI